MTVGVSYVELGEGSARDVLMDLVEMTRGVQQPMHGLFLRAYLSQMSKPLLRDKGSKCEGSRWGHRRRSRVFVAEFHRDE